MLYANWYNFEGFLYYIKAYHLFHKNVFENCSLLNMDKFGS